MTDYPEQNIIPDNEVIKPVSSKSSFLSRSNLLIFTIVMVILLLLGGIFFISSNRSSSEGQSDKASISPTISSGPRLNQNIFNERYEKFASKSAIFEQSINDLQIPDDLIEEIKTNPNYLNEGIYDVGVNLAGMDNEQAKTELKNSLTEELSEITVGAKGMYGGSDFSPGLGSILEILLYIASLSKSPYIDTDSKTSWTNAIKEGKGTVAVLLDLMGPEYKPTGEKWVNENIYSREEFK